MLDREKVIMMTRMSSYEKGKGKEHLRIGSFFRSDYIWSSILKAAFAATVSFVLIAGLYVYYNFEEFMSNIYEMDILAMLKKFGKYYIISLIIYVAVSYLVAFVKYQIAASNIRKYKSNLKRIRKLQKTNEESI
ncbi:MAG: hypothetical protein K5669_10755 [Lachnospiraceae bacterium]|nr:hypothetical protein [Lachnospiraceae bacterium]